MILTVTRRYVSVLSGHFVFFDARRIETASSNKFDQEYQGYNLNMNEGQEIFQMKNFRSQYFFIFVIMELNPGYGQC